MNYFLVYDHFRLHILVTYATVFVAGNLIDARLAEFYRGLVDIAVYGHQVDIFLFDIESVHDIFRGEEEVYLAAHGDMYLRRLKLPHLRDGIDLESLVVELGDLRFQVSFIEGEAFGEIVVPASTVQHGENEECQYCSRDQHDFLFISINGFHSHDFRFCQA